MLLVLVCVGSAIVALLALTAALRRGRSVDLVAGQMRAVAGPRSAPAPQAGIAVPTGALDEATRRRLRELVSSGSRLQAINLVRDSTGCSLAVAKAVVDRLGAPPPHLAPEMRPTEPDRRAGAPPAVRPRRPAQFPPGFDIDARRFTEEGR